jgi:hypothetical protein
MATSGQVLEMLCPAGGWIITGDDFDNVVWVDDRPRCTKAEFEAGFAQFDNWKAEQEKSKQEAKETAQAKLAALGLTTDDLKALGL